MYPVRDNFEREARDLWKKQAEEVKDFDWDIRTLNRVSERQREKLKKSFQWEHSMDETVARLVDRLENLKDHDSYRQVEIDKLQEKIYLLESQVGGGDSN